MRNCTKIYIDGAWAASTGGEVIDVISPATEFGISACMRQFVKREVMPGNLIRGLVRRSDGRSGTRFGRMHAIVRCCAALGSVQV
jgi:hypothetical protein